MDLQATGAFESLPRLKVVEKLAADFMDFNFSEEDDQASAAAQSAGTGDLPNRRDEGEAALTRCDSAASWIEQVVLREGVVQCAALFSVCEMPDRIASGFPRRRRAATRFPAVVSELCGAVQASGRGPILVPLSRPLSCYGEEVPVATVGQ